MKKLLFAAVTCLLLYACNSETSADKENTSEHNAAGSNNPATLELADSKYAQLGRDHLAAFSRADIDGWLNMFADNAVFVWNSGDSLSGKESIAAYWKNRWAKLDSIQFSKEEWLPIKANNGVRLLGWYQFDAIYKGNIKIRQWAHDDVHLNANDKIDRLVHYVDMVPIRDALAGKKTSGKK